MSSGGVPNENAAWTFTIKTANDFHSCHMLLEALAKTTETFKGTPAAEELKNASRRMVRSEMSYCRRNSGSGGRVSDRDYRLKTVTDRR